ncbi:MAG: hypothetical protein Q9179_004503 [Wetmoreana sp. 5 TL-2023]
MITRPVRPLFLLLLLFALSCSARLTGFQKRNFDTISKIYNRTVYPNNLAFIANGSASVPQGLFNKDAQGRITPVGNFTGFDDSTEYFFGLAPIPTPPSYGVFSKAQVVEFVSACPSVAASVVYFTTSVFNPNATNNGQYLSTLKQVAFWEFDRRGAVIKYDAWIPTLRLYTTASTGVLGNIDQLPPANQSSAIQTLCGTTQQLCQGNNKQYTDIEDCVKTLSAKPFGDQDNFWSDSVRCRQLHVLLARIRPAIHCPHLGPTGGGKCVDVDYNQVYFDDQALFGEPVGQNFMCH